MAERSDEEAANDEAEKYISTILGQKSPYEIIPPPESASSGNVYLDLLRADSLWNLGRTSEATEAIQRAKARDDWDEGKYGAFARGLESLASGGLENAYAAFVEAARDSAGLEAVFYTERAVNIAFWMACIGKMKKAGKLVEDMVGTTPFAGGILAFAIHMGGDSSRSEAMAQSCVKAGFDDPWTIHAVAHSMYSLGRSEECAQWLRDHSAVVKDCSPFMRGHMEFHLGLCLIDLKDTDRLMELIRGPMWGTMSKTDREDYWNATALLNLVWKANIRGLALSEASKQLDEALAVLDSSRVEASKSAVFSLCILRWCGGSFRKRWEAQIMSSENEVLIAVARAVGIAYPDGREVDVSSSAWKETWSILTPVASDLVKLGASPEQREVIEEFVAIAAKRGGADAIDLYDWDKRNRRPNVHFYDEILSQEERNHHLNIR